MKKAIITIIIINAIVAFLAFAHHCTDYSSNRISENLVNMSK